MKRIGYLYEKLLEFENLSRSFRQSFKGSKKQVQNSEYYYFLENKLLQLQAKLQSRTYQPAKYRYFKIYEPKERQISVACFEDRIVHHALVNVLEPLYEKVFIYDSYATRKNKGIHKAIERAQCFLESNKWFLIIDIEKYFASINHNILIKILKRKIKDEKLAGLVEIIIKNNDISQNKEDTGLPIGNLTSQFFANVYLDQFDHYVKEILRLDYIRYMDDMIFFSDDKQRLKEILKLSKSYLDNNLLLTIKPKSIIINKRLHGLSFLGYRIYPCLIRIKNENIKRMKKKIKIKEWEYQTGKIDQETLSQSVSSMIEFIKTADSVQIRRCIYG
jgi:RNA-directed DNA polymerase